MARKHHRKNITINPIRLPLEVQRSIILENDPVYCHNLRQLNQAQVEPQQYHDMQVWLMKSSLRRAHVPVHLASRMVSA